MSGSAVIRALSQTMSGAAVAGDAKINLAGGRSNDFSTVQSAVSGTRLTNESGLYLYTEPMFGLLTIDEQWTIPRRALLSIDVGTDGSSVFVINGSGSITVPSGQYSLSGGQYSVPGTVPLTGDLMKVDLPASPGHSVKLFVGTVPNQPLQMRVCWNIDVPGILRVSCTRHLRSDGTFVGVDAIHDLSGTLYTHIPTDLIMRGARILRCNFTYWSANPGGLVNRDGRSLVVTAFDAARTDGGSYDGMDASATQETIRYTEGSTSYSITYPRFIVSKDIIWVRDGATYFYHGNHVSTGGGLNEKCSPDGFSTEPTLTPIPAN
ncbi:MAG: hypothetical protein R3E87_25160 [Burkholderiaceae bacterium]